ncbi:MAG: hypothetical protein RIC16_08335 [Rhodospirillales bacterium]
MPFIIRDESGAIAGVFNQPVEGGEEVADDNAEFVEFVRTTAPAAEFDEQWVNSDLGLARVMEDLIDILIERNVINFTDFPDGAQKKLLERRGFRKEFAYVATLFGTPDDEEESSSGQSEYL